MAGVKIGSDIPRAAGLDQFLFLHPDRKAESNTRRAISMRALRARLAYALMIKICAEGIVAGMDCGNGVPLEQWGFRGGRVTS